MAERKISYYDASLYRIQAMLEQSIKLQVNIFASLEKLTKEGIRRLFLKLFTKKFST